MRSWLHCHPSKEIAYCLDSEEHYMTKAFERFWQITTHPQQTEFSSLSAALRYLQASLNGIILDALRANSQPGEVLLPVSVKTEVADDTTRTEIRPFLQRALPNPHEQRLAYLLFHCGLDPTTIVRSCSQEFSNVGEIYRMRRNIVERLLYNMKSNQLL